VVVLSSGDILWTVAILNTAENAEHAEAKFFSALCDLCGENENPLPLRQGGL